MEDEKIYITKGDAVLALLEKGQHSKRYKLGESWELNLFEIQEAIDAMPAADVQPVKKCRMIPQNPDCRGYADIFFCTNCKMYIDLGFIGKRYGGNFCLECGAEVEDGDAE